MSVITDEFEINSSIEPTRFFNGYILDSTNFAPKVVPGFKSCQILQGDGGVGTIKKYTFSIGDHIHFIKHITDELDETNRVFKYTVTEGGDLGEEFESITTTIKIEHGQNGGSVYKCSTAYHPKSDDHHKIRETIKRATEGSKSFFHTIEAYFRANPNEYS